MLSAERCHPIAKATGLVVLLVCSGFLLPDERCLLGFLHAQFKVLSGLFIAFLHHVFIAKADLDESIAVELLRLIDFDELWHDLHIDVFVAEATALLQKCRLHAGEIFCILVLTLEEFVGDLVVALDLCVDKARIDIREVDRKERLLAVGF